MTILRWFKTANKQGELSLSIARSHDIDLMTLWKEERIILKLYLRIINYPHQYKKIKDIFEGSRDDPLVISINYEKLTTAELKSLRGK